jgi:protein-L-isoaspartate(D-aspartate) O-methyltransferase
MTASALSHPVDTAALRVAMVASQLRTTGVNDPRVIAAMAEVPRERFLPGVAPELAYRDQLVPLGRGREANLPMATGKLMTEAYLRATDRVLLIGAAGGYTAAVLARIVAEVLAVEIDGALAAHAREALTGVANVTVVEAPLPEGRPAQAPYDVLFIDGAVETLPEALVAQLRPGGRIATGLIERGVTRLASGRRTTSGHGVVPFVDAECVVLPGFSVPLGFRF